MFTACGTMQGRCCLLSPEGSIAGALYHKLQIQSSAPEDGRNYRPKHVELFEIIDKPLLFHLVRVLFYYTCQCISFFFFALAIHLMMTILAEKRS